MRHVSPSCWWSTKPCPPPWATRAGLSKPVEPHELLAQVRKLATEQGAKQ